MAVVCPLQFCSAPTLLTSMHLLFVAFIKKSLEDNIRSEARQRFEITSWSIFGGGEQKDGCCVETDLTSQSDVFISENESRKKEKKIVGLDPATPNHKLCGHLAVSLHHVSQCGKPYVESATRLSVIIQCFAFKVVLNAYPTYIPLKRLCWRAILSKKPAGIASSKQELSLEEDLDINQWKSKRTSVSRP
ncbi:hypothetical protein KQX54_011781 [Cotesia glomerata]|uniref:Uncharacterized protein n=1 Tax=Cotesia glomerata TaxID=32391 RepID=A0AAV7J4R2_COTGL|nr:hypothetical protein KQX54_011781 [Cotesia glomerata]